MAQTVAYCRRACRLLNIQSRICYIYKLVYIRVNATENSFSPCKLLGCIEGTRSLFSPPPSRPQCSACSADSMVDGSIRAAIGVALLSVAFPVILRVLLSPWTFVFVLPSLLVISGFIGFLSYVALAHYTSAARSSERRKLLEASRPLAFSTPAAWQAVLTRSQWSLKSPHNLPPLYPD